MVQSDRVGRSAVTELQASSEVSANVTTVTILAERILEAIRFTPLDDDVLTQRLGVSRRQTVNQVARGLEAQGRLRRFVGPDGKIVNGLGGRAGPETPGPTLGTEVLLSLRSCASPKMR